MSFARPAFPVVLAAPSGAGKTTLARMVVDRDDDVVFSISATTRPPRPREQDGRDYHFVDDDTFDRMIERNELAEWAVVHGHRYGTPRREITGAIERGRTVLLDIDVQGARQVRKMFADALLVFVLPPSAQELDRRLTARASEEPGERRRRLTNARRELEAVPEFDYVVVNEDLDTAYEHLRSILRAEWARVRRIRDLERHAGRLIDDLDRIIREA
ncbi:MAG: guanylate kinase [Gemmatimonadetes bacterium]|nr:guanylate kinase [Gemmatimonadota bacterium]NIQ60002.1 guanylate kinase [Gemmatimonadota bacterium]NIU80219.1 guanylate kinase [Gammaproteobacteria bacterium]NIX48606.1 guanylate kinase [Gemmatimonadota bacterium]NIY13055.1 guanylate kinase [Gemmatimonadota bacterium]